jgi:hypothetical protein
VQIRPSQLSIFGFEAYRLRLKPVRPSRLDGCKQKQEDEWKIVKLSKVRHATPFR